MRECVRGRYKDKSRENERVLGGRYKDESRESERVREREV